MWAAAAGIQDPIRSSRIDERESSVPLLVHVVAATYRDYFLMLPISVCSVLAVWH